MSKLFLILLLISFAVTVVNAQELSEKHRRKLEKVTDPEKRERLLKKFFKKDSVRYHRKLLKSIKEQENAHLPSVPIDSTIRDEAENRIKNILKDSINTYRLPSKSHTLDSSTVHQVYDKGIEKAEQELGFEIKVPDSTSVKNKLKEAANNPLENEVGHKIPDVALDSTAVQKAKNEVIQRAEEKLKERDEFSALEGAGDDSELSSLMKQKDELEQTQEQIRQLKAQNELKHQMTSKAREFISKNTDVIQDAQSKMGELKKKYSYLPNSNDLSTARKRTSLEGELLSERLVLGGNFNVSETNPVAIDFSPMLGYRINKLFEMGVTAMYRTQFGADRNGISKSGEETYGYSMYANHMVFRNFFGYLEGERIRKSNKLPYEGMDRTWRQTLLIGIGRKFTVTQWLDLQALVLFNVLHKSLESPYESPVVFKTGFKINQSLKQNKAD